MSPYYEDLQIELYFNAEIFSVIANPDTQWIDYYSFNACLIDNNILIKDKFYNWLHKKHPFRAGILKMEGKTIYNWHKDTNRGVCINTVLPTPHTSFTFFRETEQLNHSLIELQYHPGGRFLFNNQKDHMVLNCGSPRFLLTTEFVENKNQLTYQDLLKEIRKDYIGG